MTGTNDFKLTLDIFRRVKARSKILKQRRIAWTTMTYKRAISLRHVAFKAYGDACKYFFVVCLVNNIVNRFYDWALDECNFQQFVADKYDKLLTRHTL